MIPKASAPQCDRDAQQLVQSLLARRPGYLPSTQEPFEKVPGRALAWVLARYLQTIIQRLNQAPDKNKLAFLDLVGQELVPAQAARTPIVFLMSSQATNTNAPERTQVAAPPPPEATGQVVFETERAVGLAAARITEVFSLWPGRDQYINHSGDFLAGRRLEPFQKLKLENTPHEIYLAHNTLLAFAGKAVIDVQFELAHTSDEPLEILWEYWDGKVWRRFRTVNPACLESAERNPDGTDGLTQSGTIHLTADCAETAKTTVAGREGFWIRGRLTEQLLPVSQRKLKTELPLDESLSGPDQILLPLVESLRIGTSIDRPLKASLISSTERGAGSSSAGTRVKVRNEAGQPLNDTIGTLPKISSVTLTPLSDPTKAETKRTPEADGTYLFKVVPPPYEVQVVYSQFDLRAKPDFDPTRDEIIDVDLQVEGLTPDKAFADGTSLDLSKPFFPFGQQPQPGAIFYFTHTEVFTKPNARARIYISRTKSPQDEVQVTETTPGGGDADVDTVIGEPLTPLIAWEYWNGRQWTPLALSNPLADLDHTEIVDVTVPTDMVATKVNDVEALWMRVRLVSGGFGFKNTVTWTDTRSEKRNTLIYVTTKPPVVSNFVVGYAWQQPLVPAEQVITYNDFQYEDHTFEATWPGKNFLPFRTTVDTTPTLYLGFDQKLPVDRLGLYFQILERRGDTLGPALLWEYWNGSEWRELSVDDETRNLRLPGILSFIGAEDSEPLRRFYTKLHWLRGRLKEDGPPGEPIIDAIYTNAVWAAQQQTFTDVALGASTGLPDQIFTITQIPVNEGERIEVRELFGPRANVEWRLLALDLNNNDPRVIAELENLLGREDAIGDIVKDDLRLIRDRNKRVVEVWVCWQEKPHLFFSQPQDRHYVIDRATGRVYFGDGALGRIPPPGSLIVAKKFRSGGGSVGNVKPKEIKQLLGSLPGVDAVFNPTAAEGGANGETIEVFGDRAPQSIRHRGRAITPGDYETLAHEASADIAVARVLPARNPSRRVIPGWVTLMIIPASKELRPFPSFGLRQKVQQFIASRAPADLAAAAHIYVTGPDYLPIDVEATIAPINPAEAGEVEGRARAALEDFLHPLRGGPGRGGWELGRDVFLSDLASVLERVKGVNYVEALALLLEGSPQGEQIAVPDDRIAVAGELRIKLKTAEINS